MKRYSSSSRSRSRQLWGILSVFFILIITLRFLPHWHRRKRSLYVGGAIIGLATLGLVSLQLSPKTSDVLTIPANVPTLIHTAASQSQLNTYLWYPMRVCYQGACPANPNIPVGWPNNITDSNTIRDIGANRIIWGTFGLISANSPVDPNIIAMLDWAQSVGMKVNLDDEGSWWYISKNIYTIGLVENHIKRLVQLYGSHPAFGGWYTGNEPEAWNSTEVLKEGMYARFGQVMALYKQYDPSREVFSSTATAAKLRFCREGRPTDLHNSGFSTFRDVNPLVDETSQEYQDMIDRTIFNFDEDYLCTENYNIPFNYSMAANYWHGDVITSAETTMYAYLMLAHGGRGIEWFPYSTDGGLVWDNQAPAYSQNFAHWLPAMQGGLIYQDPIYRNVSGFDNITLATDSSVKHGGSYSAHLTFAGPVSNYYNLRLNATSNSKSPWNLNFPALKGSTSYTMKGWVKIEGDAVVRLTGTGPNFSTFTSVSGTTDWVEVTKTFVTPAATGRWAFGPLIASASTGSVWFDDFSLVETNDAAQRNLAAKFNPGFETVSGADRTPHEPLYSAVKQVNADFNQLGIFTQLKRLLSFDDQHVPTTGLVSSVTSSVGTGLPRVEVGEFVSSDVNGDYYLVVVNRNISSASQITLTLRSPGNLTFSDMVAGTSQVYSSSGGQVTATFNLPAGAGKVYRLQGIVYNAPSFSPLYSESFEDSLAQGWTTQGGVWSVVNDNGSNVYDVNASSDARGILTTVDSSDFEYSGKFRIMPDHNSSSILHFTFRKLSSNPNIAAGSYNIRVQLDPGAESTNGYVQLVRNSQNSAVVCQMTDENFLLGNRYIDFKIRAIGNVIEAWFDGVKYLNCIDNSSEAYTSGQVGFRIFSGGHVRLDDLSVAALDTTSSSCTENWSCTDWGVCVNNQQTRQCTDLNACGTTDMQPFLSQSCVPPDTTPPSAVTLSATATTISSITLQWVAPGDDDNSGTASQYDIRYATTELGAALFNNATQVAGEPTPLVAGTVQSMTISGLAPATTYYFVLKSSDEIGNISGFGNILPSTTADNTPPAGITNLAVTTIATNSAILSWTAPGDDGAVGTATTYDLRYSTSPITSANFASATAVTGEPTPTIAGTTQSMTVSGLNSGTTYYFALKTSDEVPNVSVISNIVSGATTSVTPVDTIAPAAVVDLSASSPTATSLRLAWTAPGDDGGVGTATAYDLRYSTSPITSANFVSATSVTGEPTPAGGGTSQSMTVSSLTAGTTYYFAIKASDEVLNISLISNIPSGATSAAVCQERWGCTAWSSCSNNQQTRTCTDSNHCGTTVSKPTTSQSCSSTPAPTPTPVPTPVCKENYVCNDWSGCNNNQQTRTCTDNNHCSASSIKNETRVCQENVPDTIAPDTSAITIAPVINQDWIKLTLGGKDNQTASGKLTFHYSLDGQSSQTATVSTVLLRHLTNGNHTISVSAVDEAGNEDRTPFTAQFTVKSIKRIITIPKSGGPSLVRIFDYQGKLLSQFHAFSAFRRLGGSLALIDVNNDGPEELAVATGPGGKPEVKFFDQSGKLLSSFMAYPENFNGGVNLAAADLDGDGSDELIVAPASGTGPLVRIFRPSGELIAEASVFDRQFRGGVSITAGQLDSGGRASLVVAPASNGTSLISILRLENGRIVLKDSTELVKDSPLGGVSLSLASVRGQDSQIIVSLTQTGSVPEVFVLSSTLSILKQFTPAVASTVHGLQIAAGDIASFDNLAEIIVSTVSGIRQKMQIFSLGSALNQTAATRSFNPYGWSSFAVNAVIGSWR